MKRENGQRYWLFLIVSWGIFEMLIFTTLEKWVDLETLSVEKITTIFFIENLLTVLLFACNKLAKKLKIEYGIYVILLSIIILLFFLGYLPYEVSYFIIASVSWVSYLLVPYMSLVLERVAEKEKRGAMVSLVNRNKSLFKILILIVSYFLLINFLSIYVYLISSVILLLFILISLKRLRPYREGLTATVKKESSTLKGLTHIPFIYISYLIVYFLYRAVNPINQEYLKSVIGIEGYEKSLMYNIFYLLGGFCIAFVILKIVRRIKIRWTFLISMIVLIIYLLLLYNEVNVYITYLCMFVLGVMNYGITTSLSILVHERYSGEELLRYSTLIYILPYISAACALFIFGKLSVYGIQLMISFVMVGIILYIPYLFINWKKE